jgi:hypothetical protein
MAKKENKISVIDNLLKQAVELIHTARQQAIRQTNSLMVFTYFHLGKLIIEQEQCGNKKAALGEEIIK